MKKINFNKDWNFTFENDLDAFNAFGFEKYSDAAGAAARFYDHNNWHRVDLPHDWSLMLQKDPLANPMAGGYPNTQYHRFMEERRSKVETVYNVGWYRKQFTIAPEWVGKRVFLELEGVFRDAVVWVNGAYMDRHTSGYTGFVIEITDHLVNGEDNSIAVRVDSEQAEGWWYEGAGIYRNVNLLIGEPVYFQHDQTVVKTDLNGRVDASAVLVNDTPVEVQKSIAWTVTDADGNSVAQAETEAVLPPYGETRVQAVLTVEAPKWWSVDTPYLYTLTLQADGEQFVQRFGIRTVGFDPDRGFLLNGQPQKVRGACVHQDFGGVGIALPDNLQYYKIKRLKEMGVNAYRCAHHAPAPALLDACDELGMLVMDETRMFGTSPEATRQLTALIERDRNHPCVFIWSLGNEEFSVQNVEWSFRLMEKATRIAKKLDPTRPVTYGGNNGSNFVGANGAAEIRGVNYLIGTDFGKWMDTYHLDHPEQPIIGTEESSYVLSRGGAVNDLGSRLLDSTGNVTMPWGTTPKWWVKYTETRDYLAGSFMWTGFDYRGEPNPFNYSNISSSFGTIDLCGMEKPPFYYYKAWWTDEPVLKLTPHWNHKMGDVVTMAVFTNCEEITLSLNGKPLQTRKVERFDAPLFQVAFEPGVLSVEGKRNGVTLYDELVTSQEPTALETTLVWNAKNEDEVAIYEVNAYDADGRFCPLAANELEISAENGSIVGVGNGDPSNMDYEQKPMEEKTVFIRTFQNGNEIFSVPQKKANALGYRTDWIKYERIPGGTEEDFRLIAGYTNSFPENYTKEFVTTLSDVEGFEYIEFERLGGSASVYLNGELIGENVRWHGRQTRTGVRPYRFYANFQKGTNEVKVVIRYGEHAEPLMSGYVKVGKRVETPWHVKLHYGKARVFVKSKTPDAVWLKVDMK